MATNPLFLLLALTTEPAGPATPTSSPAQTDAAAPSAEPPAAEPPAADPPAADPPAADPPPTATGEGEAGSSSPGAEQPGTDADPGADAPGDEAATPTDPTPAPAPTSSPAPESTEAEPTPPPASTPPPADEPSSTEPEETKWIDRYAPVPMTAEVGVYGGIWIPHRLVELYQPNPMLPNDGFQSLRRVTPSVGIRGGFYPLRHLGVETELGVLPTRTRQTEARAITAMFRGQVVGQLGLWSVTPFLVAGAGLLGMVSPESPEGLGRDVDFAFHFGAGVKFYINRWIQLRLDIKNVVSNQQGIADGLVSSPEITLGISITPRPKRREPDPPSDRDGDGYLDPVDECVDIPEDFDGVEDEDGCPEEPPPKVEEPPPPPPKPIPKEVEKFTGVIKGIVFDFDKDTIKSQSLSVLDGAVEVLKKYPDLHVRIEGHTDNYGSYEYNIDLSKRRADSVRRYLIEQGIDASRLTTQGFGYSQPVDTNSTDEGRANNRRIEFHIVDTGTSSPAPEQQ